ncbi:MAG: PH domain-containing protein [Zoogloeaceae bacterium]|nr:PH domain-containing protein [Zoogloeaceae bacterium]
MGSHVRNSLISGERIESEAQISWMSQFWYFLFAILTIPTIVLPILLLGIAAINVLTTELAVTNKKMIGKTGFIRRVSIDIPLTKLESINVDQGIIGRIFNFGSVAVRGIGGNSVGIPYISAPLDFRRVILNLVDGKQPE